MTTKKRTPPPPPPPPRHSTVPWLWIVIGLLVLLAGGIAVLSAGGGDGEVTAGTTAADGSSSSAAEVQPVTIDGASLIPLGDPAADAAVGEAAPTLSGFTFAGAPISVDPSKGPVMLVFLAHWCPHCNAEIPRLLEWKANGAVPADLQVIAVTTGVSPSRDNYPPSQWMADKGWDWPILADSATSEAALAYGVSAFPFIAIVGQDGFVKARVTGEIGRDSIDAYTELVAAALS